MTRVTAAVMERQGKILIAKRKRGSHLEHKWEFPGGKIEDNETPEECLHRELFEEFGIETRIGEFICSTVHTYSRGTIELLAYHAEHISGQFRLTSHQEIRWVEPSELDSYDIAEADKPIVAKLREVYGVI